MLVNKNKVNIALFMILIALLFTLSYLIWKQNNNTKKQYVRTEGLSKGQGQYFKRELSAALQVPSYIQEGKRRMASGNYDGAIESFKAALSFSKMMGEKGMSMEYVVDAYEKKRDYANAVDWMVKVRNSSSEWSRKPDIERVEYLQYALQGDYDLAIQHAQKAVIEIEAIEAGLKPSYLSRLDDLKSAKDYILSLKKN